VLILNRLAGRPVNEQDLAVAVYVHDFGMAFIPVELLHKQTQLDDAEILLLRSHVQSSAQLLQQLPRWQAAREIVLQHHEAVDGSGYPFGLREREISDGAKMLAIADSFDAMTHHRAYASHQKRPIIRAVKEINQCAGKQLSPYWVEVFNRAVAPVLAARKQRGSSH
jgi:HD-GYP domain-containing protein (c-di-GMP phosphodiesterase class II)